MGTPTSIMQDKRRFDTEVVGISVFYKDPGGTVFHTYSCYSRGLDLMNGAFSCKG